MEATGTEAILAADVLVRGVSHQDAAGVAEAQKAFAICAGFDSSVTIFQPAR